MKQHLRNACAFLAAGAVALAPLPAAHADGENYLTVLATTDVHGHVFNWDYFADAPYPQGSTKELGLARADSAIDSIRAEKGADSVVTVENGDAIQGTPLTYLAAMQPDKLPSKKNPMAEAFNLIGYDAMNLGNHEFNYGLDYMNSYISQLDAPVLGANILKHGTDEPAYTPYVIVDKVVGGKTVKVGILGLDTPGVRIWDRNHVRDVLDFKDGVAVAQKYVPQMKAEGADVVVAAIHSGLDPEGSEWNPEELQEQVARSLATKVNDIDVVIAGHSHSTKSLVFTAPDGDTVLFAQPTQWARAVAEVDVPIVFDANGKATVATPADADAAKGLIKQHYTSDYPDSPDFTNNAVLTGAHEATVKYVNTPVAESIEELSAAASYWKDTPILDIIGQVERETVKKALQGTEHENVTVIAQASPFSRKALFPKGQVTIKDIAGLYTYDNTLLGVKLTGAQVKDYLEWSVRYYNGVEEGGVIDPETVGNAIHEDGQPTPDYAVDMLTGVDYLIDLSKPNGQRILNLSYPDGTLVGDDDVFVLAINNYRQSGGRDYPHVPEAEVVYDETVEIRQAIIDRAAADGVIDPAVYFEDNWALVTATPTPTVTTDKASYELGDTISVTLAGFLPGRTTKVSLGEGSEPVVVTTDENGAATVELMGEAAGTLTIKALQSALWAEAAAEVVTPSEDPVDPSDEPSDEPSGEPSDEPADGPSDQPSDQPDAPTAEDRAKPATDGPSVGPVAPAPAALTPTRTLTKTTTKSLAKRATKSLAKTGASTGIPLLVSMSALMAIGTLLRRKAD